MRWEGSTPAWLWCGCWGYNLHPHRCEWGLPFPSSSAAFIFSCLNFFYYLSGFFPLNFSPNFLFLLSPLKHHQLSSNVPRFSFPALPLPLSSFTSLIISILALGNLWPHSTLYSNAAISSPPATGVLGAMANFKHPSRSRVMLLQQFVSFSLPVWEWAFKSRLLGRWLPSPD